MLSSTADVASASKERPTVRLDESRAVSAASPRPATTTRCTHSRSRSRKRRTPANQQRREAATSFIPPSIPAVACAIPSPARMRAPAPAPSIQRTVRRNRNSVERSAPPPLSLLSFHRVSCLKGAFARHGNVGIQRGVVLFDAREARARELDGRGLLAAQEFRRLLQRQASQLSRYCERWLQRDPRSGGRSGLNESPAAQSVRLHGPSLPAEWRRGLMVAQIVDGTDAAERLVQSEIDACPGCPRATTW
jgi:hypothetical protein